MRKLLKLFLVLFCVGFTVLPGLCSIKAYDVSDGSYVIDDANILSAAEELMLESKISLLRVKHNYDIVIVTNPTTNGQSAMDYADDYYDYNGYGYGRNRDGMLFLITFNDNEGYRTYWTSTTGCGIDAFTDYGIDLLGDEIRPYLLDGDYYRAFDKYLDLCDEFLEEYEKGTPYDYNHPRYSKEAKGGVIGASGIVGAIISFITVGTMRSKLSNTRKASKENQYYNWGDVDMRNRSDIFLYSHTVSHRIQRSSGGGGGGGGGGGSSVHISSSGSSHGGGGGHF